MLSSLTIFRWLNVRESLGLQDLVVAIVCDLQDKTPVHHTVTGLQATVGHSAVMKVLHTLRQKHKPYSGDGDSSKL